MTFYIIAFIVTVIFILVFKNKLLFHICLISAMYLFYAYLWIDQEFLYDGKAGWRGFQMFMMTSLTAPFYIIYHLCTLFVARSQKDKQIIILSLIGLALCAIHLIAVFS